MNVNQIYLPPECQIMIVERLDIEDAVIYERVCKLWQEVILESPEYLEIKVAFKKLKPIIKNWDLRLIETFGGVKQICKIPITHEYENYYKDYLECSPQRKRIELGFDEQSRAFFCLPVRRAWIGSGGSSVFSMTIFQKHQEPPYPTGQWRNSIDTQLWGGRAGIDDTNYAYLKKLISGEAVIVDKSCYTLLNKQCDWLCFKKCCRQG